MFIAPDKWQHKLTLTLDCIPKVKQSTRFRAYIDKESGKAKGFAYQTNEIKKDSLNIRAQIQSQLPKGFKVIDSPMEVRVNYIHKLPKTALNKFKAAIKEAIPVYKDTSPDLNDNLNKGLFDAMQGIVFTNDSKIIILSGLTKVYGEEDKTEITIWY